METMIARLRAAGEFAVDAVYPKRCSGCGRRGAWVCPECDRALMRFESPWCARCGVPDVLGDCKCEDLPPALSWVRSLGPFDGWLKGDVVQIKYHGEWARAARLGPLMAPLLKGLSGDVLTPVPLHPARLRHRGFNQSLVLARHVARHTGIDVADALQRIRPTDSQVALGARERRQNVKEAFALKRHERIAGQSIVLIDDVITTGSTLAASADALLRAGAVSVGALTVAREL